MGSGGVKVTLSVEFMPRIWLLFSILMDIDTLCECTDPGQPEASEDVAIISFSTSFTT